MQRDGLAATSPATWRAGWRSTRPAQRACGAPRSGRAPDETLPAYERVAPIHLPRGSCLRPEPPACGTTSRSSTCNLSDRFPVQRPKEGERERSKRRVGLRDKSTGIRAEQGLADISKHYLNLRTWPADNRIH